MSPKDEAVSLPESTKTDRRKERLGALPGSSQKVPPQQARSHPNPEHSAEPSLRQKERELAEARQALERSQEDLQSVLDSIPGYLWSSELDSEGRCIKAYTSPAAEKITGRPPEFYKEGMEKWLSTIHPEDLPRLQQIAASLGAGETSKVTTEYRIIHPDGSVRWVSGNTGVRRIDGHTRIAGVVSDITERKLAEEARRDSEERFHTTFENAGIGIALVDLKGHPFKSNLAFREMLGYSEEELHQIPFTEFTHQDDRSRDWALARDLVEGKLNRFEIEKRYIKKDGRVVWGHLTASAVKDFTGQPQYLIAMVKDITDHHAAVEALRQSEQFNWEVIQGAREGVIVYDTHFRYQVWNPFMEELTGVRFSEVLGRRPWEIFPNLQKHNFEALLCRALAGETVEAPDLDYDPGDNRRPVWTSATFSPHYGPAHRIIGVIGLVRDISARKQAEIAVQESERLLRLFVQHAPAAIAMLDRKMRYMVVSQRWMTDFNLGGRDVQGLSHYAVFPELPSHWKEIHQRCLAGAVQRCEEDSFLRRDGKLDWLRWEVRPWRRGNDEIGGLVIFSEVITERKQAQEALHESQTRQKHIARASNTGFWDWDLRTNTVYFSPEWKRQLGHTEGEISDSFEEWAQRLHPDDRDRSLAWTREYLAKPQGEFENEFRLRHKDGSYRWILAQGFVRSYADGKPSRMTGSHIDMTERKLAEERIEASEERFRKAFMTGADAFYITRLKDGKILEINDRFTDVFGYSRDAAVGKTTLELGMYVDPTDRKRLAAEVKTHGCLRNREILTRKKGGESITVSISANLLEEKRGEPILLNVTRDMTESKRAQDELQRSFEQLQALGARLLVIREEERTRVAREIHDQLGQTLTAIKLDLKSLFRETSVAGKRPPKRASEILALVDESIDTVRRIATELRPGILDELGLVAALEWAAEDFAARSGTKCRLDFPPDNFTVEAERATALFRIFQETLTNIARHAEATEVAIKVASEAGHLIMEVRDNGKGIPASKLLQGKSLGLLGMRERAKLVGGELEITGRRGTGTTVSVRIPEATMRFREAEL